MEATTCSDGAAGGVEAAREAGGGLRTVGSLEEEEEEVEGDGEAGGATETPSVEPAGAACCCCCCRCCSLAINLGETGPRRVDTFPRSLTWHQ